MDHKQPLILHELLQQDQDPFHLQTYISDKRFHLYHSSPAAAAAPEFSAHRRHIKNLCFASSPDVTKPPFIDFHPSAISRGACSLHVPPRIAAVLAEAATRIQNQRRRNVGLSFFGSFFKILKHRSRNKIPRNCDLEERENSEDQIRISCSCNDDLRASSFHDTADSEARNCSGRISPFVFSPFKSPSFSGRRSPESCSPAATSAIRHEIEEEENFAAGVEEEKEQCSPVSILDDTFFEDDEHGSLAGEEDDDHDLDRYANIERARHQLLERLERFEKLAALDHVDLEEKLLEASEEIEGVEIYEHLPLSKLDTSIIKQSPMKMCADMKRLAGDDECQVVLRRSSRHLSRQAKFGAIDMMVELEAWERWSEEVEETVEEMEVEILEGLMEECYACID